MKILILEETLIEPYPTVALHIKVLTFLLLQVNEGGSPMKSSQRAPFYESMAGLSLQETRTAPPAPPARSKAFSWAQVVGGGGGSSKPSASPQTQFNRGPNKVVTPSNQAYDSVMTAAPSGKLSAG